MTKTQLAIQKKQNALAAKPRKTRKKVGACNSITYVYDFKKKLVGEFEGYEAVGDYFGSKLPTIRGYVNGQTLYKGMYYISHIEPKLFESGNLSDEEQRALNDKYKIDFNNVRR